MLRKTWLVLALALAGCGGGSSRGGVASSTATPAAVASSPAPSPAPTKPAPTQPTPSTPNTPAPTSPPTKPPAGPKPAPQPSAPPKVPTLTVTPPPKPAPAPAPDPMEPPAKRGAIKVVAGKYSAVKLDERTITMLANGARWLRTHGGCDPGHSAPKNVVQGSYNAGGVAASAGTHDRGGVMDLHVLDLTPAERLRFVRALREAGFAAWLRVPPAFPYHVHAVAIGDPDLSPSAKNQVRAYFNGRDGLAANAKDPHGGPIVKPWMKPFMK